MAVPEVVVPVRGIGRNLDNDSPNYEFAPGLLLVVALAYDSLTGPDAVRDAGGVLSPDFTRMRLRLAVGWREEENGYWIVDLRPAIDRHWGSVVDSTLSDHGSPGERAHSADLRGHAACHVYRIRRADRIVPCLGTGRRGGRRFVRSSRT
jgi:hypothetical protein